MWGKMKNGVRHFRFKWLDGTSTWEPDTCVDPDVLKDLNRRFTKAGTLRKSNFKTKFKLTLTASKQLSLYSPFS